MVGGRPLIRPGEPLRYKNANVVSSRFYYSARRHKRPQESQLRAGDPDLRLPHVDTLRKRLDMMPAIAALIGPHLASRLGCKFHDDIGSDLNGMSPAFAIHPQHIGTGGVTYRLELHQPNFQVLILRVGHPILNGRIEARKLAVGVGGFLANLKAPIDLIDAALALVGMPENTLDEIALKRNAFERLHSGLVIGNPPWEGIKLQEQEFFASRSPEIATAPNKAARERLIKALANAAPDTPAARLLADFEIATRLPAFCSK
jgi:hypothetical protein